MAVRSCLSFAALAALAIVAGCGGGNGASPFIGGSSSPAAIATTVPVPAATSTTAAIPVPGGTPLTVTLPPVTGAPTGSTIAISASSTRPATLPSAAPQSPVYVTVTLPTGASMSTPPSLTSAPGSSFGFGPVSLSSAVTALARVHAATATPSPNTYSVIYDPGEPQYSAFTYSQSQVLGTTIYGSGFVPYQYSLVPGSSVQLFLDDDSPNQRYLGLVPTSVAQQLTLAASSSPCTGFGGAPCAAFTLTASAQYPTNVPSFPIMIIDNSSGIGGIATVFVAASKTTTGSFGAFNEFPGFNASGPIPLLPNTFSSADLSLPAVSPASSTLPLTITTSITPLDTNLDFAIESLRIESHVAAINFSFPEQLTFGNVGNLSSDFCFNLTAPPLYIAFSYVGTTYKQLPAAVTINDATCPNATHVSVPSDFGSAPIPANTNFGLIIATKTGYTKSVY